MGIDTVSWRQRIGCFSQPIKSKSHTQTLTIGRISVIIRLLLFLLLVVHGVESNPGPETVRGRGRGSASGRGSGNRGRGRQYFQGPGQQRRSERIASATGLTASQGGAGRGRGGQCDISAWLHGGAQSQPVHTPQHTPAWGQTTQDSGNQPYNPGETMLTNDTVYSSDSNTEQDDGNELDNESNVKAILLDIRCDVRKINTKFDKMKKICKRTKKEQL